MLFRHKLVSLFLLPPLLLLFTPPGKSQLGDDNYKRCFETNIRRPFCLPRQVWGEVDPEYIRTEEELNATNHRSLNEIDVDFCYSAIGDFAPDEDISNHFPGLENVSFLKMEERIPFACHFSPCSLANEAVWLGLFGRREGRQFVYDRVEVARDVIETDYAQDLSFKVRWFRQMVHPHNRTNFGQLSPDIIKSMRTPFYMEQPGWSHLKAPVNLSHNPVTGYFRRLVPFVCDPRSMLYCREHLKIQRFEIEPEKTVIPEHCKGKPGGQMHPCGQCECHPLYAEDGEDEDRPTPEGSFKNIRVIPACYAKANVPCSFSRRNVSELPELEKNGTFDKLGVYFSILELDDRLNPQKSIHSKCIEDAECKPFSSPEEERSFRRGEIFHGFGFAPLIRDAMLLMADRICKCKDGMRETALHACVEVD